MTHAVIQLYTYTHVDIWRMWKMGACCFVESIVMRGECVRMF